MALQKKGLGRGLDALMNPDFVGEATDTKDKVQSVSVLQIDTNMEQPRKSFDEDALKELAASIKVHGIVQPIIVKEKKGRYMIIAGERRFRAARMAGLTTVPVLLADYDDAQIHEVSLIENIQRENLNPIEEAAAIRFLMKQHDMTQEEVSSRLGKSRPAVANSLRLLQLPDSVVDMLKDGRLSAGHGRALAGLDEKATAEELANETLQMGYSVRALESRIKNLADEKNGAKQEKKDKKTPRLTADMQQVEDTFREKLGTKVKIQGTEAKGKITIEYFTREDLERVYACIDGGK